MTNEQDIIDALYDDLELIDEFLRPDRPVSRYDGLLLLHKAMYDQFLLEVAVN